MPADEPDEGHDDRDVWARAGIPYDDIAGWKSWHITPAEARLWRSEGITDGLAAARWRTAGVQPHEVGGWTAEGIDATEAVRWHEWGLTLEEVKEEKAAGREPGDRGQGHTFSIRATRGMAVPAIGYPGQSGPMLPVMRLLRTGNRFIHGYMERQWTDESAMAWAAQHISVDDAYLWSDLGITAVEAGRLTSAGHSPGQIIRNWWRTGIPFEEVAEWIGAGLSPDEAVEQRANGVTAEQAAALRALRTDEPAPAPDRQEGRLHSRMGPPSAEEPGPPPDDPDTARAEITAAFEGMTNDLDGDGGLANVDGGENLGPSLEQARRQVDAETSSKVTVSGIRFINDHQARVAWEMVVGNPMHLHVPGMIGGAVLVDGTWKVTRDTVVQLLARAGVTCPPRAED